MSVIDTRMLCGMRRPARKDTIRNELVWEKLVVASVEDKMREARFRWFGNVKTKTFRSNEDI